MEAIAKYQFRKLCYHQNVFFIYSVVTENEENTFVAPGMNC